MKTCFVMFHFRMFVEFDALFNQEPLVMLIIFLTHLICYVSGPSNWGTMNPDWILCTHGQQQSPIDVNPKALLFDPNLKYLEYSGNVVIFLYLSLSKCKDLVIVTQCGNCRYG